MPTYYRPPWISLDSRNGDKVLELLERIAKWKATSGLTGAKEANRHVVGCYGNPDSKVIFIAEIPSLSPIHSKVNKLTPISASWIYSWNVSRGDKLFRRALIDNEFIPEGADDEPWKWNCWLTNFVKCPEIDGRWHAKGGWKGVKSFQRIKEKALEKSHQFLKEEIRIIKPRCIVFVGNMSEKYFGEHPRDGFFKIPHYAAHISEKELKKIYKSEFEKVRRYCKI